MVGNLELPHDIAGVITFESFVGNSGAGDISAIDWSRLMGDPFAPFRMERNTPWPRAFGRMKDEG